MSAYEQHSAVLAEMDEMRRNKPRPLAKLYGRQGPTDEQRAKWEADMRAWNAKYRRLSKEQKRLLEQSNREFYASRKESDNAGN